MTYSRKLSVTLVGVLAFATVTVGTSSLPEASAAPGCQSFGIVWNGTQTGAVKHQCQSVQAKRAYRTTTGLEGSVQSAWTRDVDNETWAPPVSGVTNVTHWGRSMTGDVIGDWRKA